MQHWKQLRWSDSHVMCHLVPGKCIFRHLINMFPQGAGSFQPAMVESDRRSAGNQHKWVSKWKRWGKWWDFSTHDTNNGWHTRVPFQIAWVAAVQNGPQQMSSEQLCKNRGTLANRNIMRWIQGHTMTFQKWVEKCGRKILQNRDYTGIWHWARRIHNFQLWQEPHLHRRNTEHCRTQNMWNAVHLFRNVGWGCLECGKQYWATRAQAIRRDLIAMFWASVFPRQWFNDQVSSNSWDIICGSMLFCGKICVINIFFEYDHRHHNVLREIVQFTPIFLTLVIWHVWY